MVNLGAGFGGERPAKEAAHGSHVQQALLRVQSLPGKSIAEQMYPHCAFIGVEGKGREGGRDCLRCARCRGITQSWGGEGLFCPGQGQQRASVDREMGGGWGGSWLFSVVTCQKRSCPTQLLSTCDVPHWFSNSFRTTSQSAETRHFQQIGNSTRHSVNPTALCFKMITHVSTGSPPKLHLVILLHLHACCRS